MAIINSYSLMSFANGKRMQVGNFTNSNDGSTFKSCIFTNKTTGDRQFVSFSSNLGELTPAEISARKHELQVVELDSGSFKLCKQGQEAWEDVAL